MIDSDNKQRFRMLDSPGFKAFGIGLLVLFLLIPMTMIRGLVNERRNTRNEAETAIIEPAGGRPKIFGPYLVLPYEYTTTDGKREGQLVLFAEDLKIEGEVKTELRSRGIFSAPVIAADLCIQGRLNTDGKTLASAVQVGGPSFLWGRARLVMELGDVRTLRETPKLLWNDVESDFKAAQEKGLVYGRGLSALVPAAADRRIDFSMRLSLRGGRAFSVLEPAGTVSMNLSGDWLWPSFTGYLSPVERSVGESGFSASWYMPASAQIFPIALDSASNALQSAEEAELRVEFLDGVDGYAKTWRAVRYGVLFLIVPFLVLFLFELLSGIRLHPIQYILIGLADCVFYLLLLSLYEIIGFGPAYLVSALACSVMAAVYAGFALRSIKGLSLFPALSLLYVYLYITLRSEDYALLMGAIGLFVLLALVMIVTRKIDWYGVRRGKDRGAPSQQ